MWIWLPDMNGSIAAKTAMKAHANIILVNQDNVGACANHSSHAKPIPTNGKLNHLCHE